MLFYNHFSVLKFENILNKIRRANVDTNAISFFENKDTEVATKQFIEYHEKGFNSDEYINNNFPIDIQKVEADEKQSNDFVSIDDIESDIFAKSVKDDNTIVEKEIKADNSLKLVPLNNIPFDELEKKIFAPTEKNAQLLKE